MIKVWFAALALVPVIGWLAGAVMQVTPTEDAVTSVITAIAGSSPFAALAMYVIVGQKSDLKQAHADKDALIKDVIERVIPGQVESNRLHGEVVRALESATVHSHQLAARSYDPQTQAEILKALRLADPQLQAQILDQLRRLRGPR